MEKTHSDQTNKHEWDRNPPYKQDHVLLFTVTKTTGQSRESI